MSIPSIIVFCFVYGIAVGICTNDAYRREEYEDPKSEVGPIEVIVIILFMTILGCPILILESIAMLTYQALERIIKEIKK